MLKLFRSICRLGRSGGFTLIELLIVVAIIAILAAIAVPNFLEAQTRAKVSRTKADIKTLVTGLELYKLDNNKYLDGLLSTDLAERYIRPQDQVATGRREITKLSSPIAYLTSMPVNPPFGPYRGYGYAETGEDEKGYRYYGESYWKSALVGGIPSIFPQSYKNTTYLLWAVGPSKKYSVYASVIAPRFVPYDATNGTVSVGEVMYAAGESGGWNSFN